MDATHAKKHRGVDHAVGGRTGGGVIETGRVFTKTQGRASLKLTEALFLAESLTSGAETIRSDKPGRLNLTDRNLAWATYCEQLLASEQAKNDTIRRYCEPLSTLERIYSASLVYALAQPPARRKRLAMFFTPPRLSEYVLDRVEKFGVDFQSDRFIDPAAGGASFIGPIAHRKLTKGAAPDSILDTVFGVEIDPGLADFARAAARSVVGIDATPMVETGDGLKLGAEASFDCVIGNPPYRVLSPHQRRRMPAWAKSTLANYANLYALFILRSLQLLRDGGTMALLIPTSFITGMYFSSLRAHISSHAEVLAIDTIVQRKEFFRDVSQDVCLLVCRKTSAPQSHCASARAVGRDLNWVASEDYEISPGAPDPWLPRPTVAGIARHVTLESYGYAVTCGSIVHNRDTGLSEGIRRKRKHAVPLVWGHVIKPGATVAPASRRSPPGEGKITFVSTKRATPPIVKPSIVLQRTTSGDQARRIRAGIVDRSWIDTYGGFYGENHVVVVSPLEGQDQAVDLQSLLRVLSSGAVDKRLRSLLSSNSVNVTALRTLALPDLARLSTTIFKTPDLARFEATLEKAYK